MAGNIFIDAAQLQNLIEVPAAPDPSRIREILSKGMGLEGLAPDEAALLINAGEELADEIFDTASHVKQKIYGNRLVFFTPIYISNHCVNYCNYCGFNAGNRAPRKKLAIDELREQTARIINMGHKRVLLEAGEDEKNNHIDYILEAIDAIYSVTRPGGEIRRININIAATTTENYRRLKERDIGTYQLFQETYHRPTYERMHRGPKGDYERQLFAIDRAFEGGIDDVGLGALFGLYDWRFEVLAIISHANYLQKTFGVGPHTISVPRLRPAKGARMTPPCPVSDRDFLKLIAILRISVPYTGMIITTRETPEIRSRAFMAGITQASAASSTSPGGFGKSVLQEASQFELYDRRSLDEIALSAMREGITPSFCTACYRRNRTGEAFMELARPGEIQEFCQPNSILTLMEYLEDHASSEGKRMGIEMIERELGGIRNMAVRRRTKDRLSRIRNGERDIYF